MGKHMVYISPDRKTKKIWSLVMHLCAFMKRDIWTRFSHTYANKAINSFRVSNYFKRKKFTSETLAASTGFCSLYSAL